MPAQTTVWGSCGFTFAPAKANRVTLRLVRLLRCTAEHLRPKQDGGGDTFSNIAAACWLCNKRRHAQRKIAPTPETYRALVQRRVSRKRWHAPQVFERGLIVSG
ncbi:MAG: HNH endonuclease [Gammaproteobacteria bacterium]|nr:HNH endonuclease [Gammaproteobacteria bacterium]